MLKRHYNSREIINSAESTVDGLLAEFDYSNENWQVLHGLQLSNNLSNRTGRGECDFICICPKGILVLEVKGGKIMYKDAHIIQKDHDGVHGRVIDPYGQVRGNCESLIQLLRTKLKIDVYVGESVVFPESAFTYTGDAYKNFWHLKANQSLCKFLESSLRNQCSALHLPVLSSENIAAIVKTLIPEVGMDQSRLNIEYAKKDVIHRGEINKRIFSGLAGNKRMAIEGPPGSGKTTFARDYILRKVKEENFKVLYLCWNELLAATIRDHFEKTDVADQVKACCYYDYVNHLLSVYADQPIKLDYAELENLGDHVRDSLCNLESVNMLEKYDLIVIDEAQDLFHKGIDIILEKQLNGGGQLYQKKEFIIFYDFLQAYDSGKHAELYNFVMQVIKDYSAYFKLFKSFRTIEGSGIANFLDDTQSGSVDLDKHYGSDLTIKFFSDFEGCLSQVKQFVKNECIKDKVPKNEIVVLFTSNLISGNDVRQYLKPLDNKLANDDEFQQLTNENVNSSSEKIQFTTALKFKGLERDVVVMVVQDLFNQSHKTLYQLYIGVSRARAKVLLLIDDASAKQLRRKQLSLALVDE